MKNLTTMICCLFLAAFGATVGLNNKHPASVANAEPVITQIPLDLRLPKIKYDTVFMCKDSIIPCKKNHYPKYKEIKVPYTVTDTLYVPVITTIILKDRKESSLDSTTFSIIRDNTEQIQKPIEIPDSVMSDSIE